MPRKPTYFELLKHPNWQRKRLEIMNRADFQCESCGAKDITLHVHHTFYEKDLPPWEYPSESLRCLCETCHKHIGDKALLLKRLLGILAERETDHLIGYAMGWMSKAEPDRPLIIPGYDFALGLGDCWQIHPMALFRLLRTKFEWVIDGNTLASLSKDIAEDPKIATELEGAEIMEMLEAFKKQGPGAKGG